VLSGQQPNTNLNFALKNSHPRFKSRKFNDDMSARTRSKADYTDQDVGNRTRFKMQSICNSSIQNLLFSLYDTTLFQGHGKFENEDL
jgi:hypothetical protein